MRGDGGLCCVCLHVCTRVCDRRLVRPVSFLRQCSMFERRSGLGLTGLSGVNRGVMSDLLNQTSIFSLRALPVLF